MKPAPGAETHANLTPHVRLGRVAVVANCASGSVGPAAPAEVERILASFGIEGSVAAPAPEGIGQALKDAVAGKPDLLVVLAGDGTARAAASLCGPAGPLVAPLPGGTMNILPKALYGPRTWQAALTDALTTGTETAVGGGEVNGEAFFVAAILGSPALFAEAREAARHGKVREALERVRRAYRRAFSSRLRYVLDGRESGKTEALGLLCPLISRTMDEDTSLEAAAFNPTNTAEVLRLGLRAALAGVSDARWGDWRDDPAVRMSRCRSGRAWARHGIPATLDGEPMRLGREVRLRFHRKAFRALVPAPEA